MRTHTWIKAVKDTFQLHADSVAGAVDTGVAVATDIEILSDIPIIGTGLKLLQARDNFMEIRFRRNCIALLEACERVDLKARQDAMEALAADPKRFEDFADTLLLIATDSSKPLKATIVGNLLAALMEDKLDYGKYNDLVQIVHSASIPALLAFQTYFERTGGLTGSTSRGEIRDESLLMSTGLASRFGNKFTISDLGFLLNSFGFNGNQPDV